MAAATSTSAGGAAGAGAAATSAGGAAAVASNAKAAAAAAATAKAASGGKSGSGAAIAAAQVRWRAEDYEAALDTDQAALAIDADLSDYLLDYADGIEDQVRGLDRADDMGLIDNAGDEDDYYAGDGFDYADDGDAAGDLDDYRDALDYADGRGVNIDGDYDDVGAARGGNVELDNVDYVDGLAGVDVGVAGGGKAAAGGATKAKAGGGAGGGLAGDDATAATAAAVAAAAEAAAKQHTKQQGGADTFTLRGGGARRRDGDDGDDTGGGDDGDPLPEEDKMPHREDDDAAAALAGARAAEGAAADGKGAAAAAADQAADHTVLEGANAGLNDDDGDDVTAADAVAAAAATAAAQQQQAAAAAAAAGAAAGRGAGTLGALLAAGTRGGADADADDEDDDTHADAGHGNAADLADDDDADVADAGADAGIDDAGAADDNTVDDADDDDYDMDGGLAVQGAGAGVKGAGEGGAAGVKAKEKEVELRLRGGDDDRYYQDDYDLGVQAFRDATTTTERGGAGAVAGAGVEIAVEDEDGDEGFRKAADYENGLLEPGWWKEGLGNATNATAGGATAGAGVVTAAAAVGDSVASKQRSCGVLSRELLARYAKNNTVLLTFTNTLMYKNFGATWLHNIRKAGITYWVLAVADNHTAAYVHSQGAHQCFMGEENEIDDIHSEFKWGSKSWSLHTWQKVLTVRHVHQLGFNVINSDMDVVWLRDPLEHFLVKYPKPDYWVSMDPITTRNPIGDEGPEAGVTVHHYMNTGVYFLRATAGGRALIDKWYQIRKEMQGHNLHDQDGLYKYLTANPERVDPDARVTYVLDGKTALAQLPATLFQNGYSHCINQIHKVHGVQPFEVHFVWVWGNNAGKIMRIREQGYFIDPPEYYSAPNFLTIDILPVEDPIGYNDWNDTEAMVQTHLRAMESQLVDMYYGFALAGLLNRTLVLPKMKCFCIQNWFESPQCRLPGEPHTRFPLTCPADYVFNMDELAALNFSGSPIPVREYSFLDNARTPQEVKDRPLVLAADPGAGSAFREGDVIKLPRGLRSAALLQALEPFLAMASGGGAAAGQQQQQRQQRQPKRVHVRNPRELFGGWDSPQQQADWDAVMARLGVKWCCRPEVDVKAHKVTPHHQLTVRAALPMEHHGATAAAEGGLTAGNGGTAEVRRRRGRRLRSGAVLGAGGAGRDGRRRGRVRAD